MHDAESLTHQALHSRPAQASRLKIFHRFSSLMMGQTLLERETSVSATAFDDHQLTLPLA